MAKKELIDFLKLSQKLKLNLESIGRELVKAGWTIKDVDDAMRAVKPLRAPLAPLKAPKAPSAAAAAAGVAEAKPKPRAKPKPAEKKEEELKAPAAPIQKKPADNERKAIELIKKLRAQGMSDEQIWAAFVDKGWKPDVIGKLIEKSKE